MHTGRERVNGIHHRKFITHTFFSICQIHEKENFKKFSRETVNYYYSKNIIHLFYHYLPFPIAPLFPYCFDIFVGK